MSSKKQSKHKRSTSASGTGKSSRELWLNAVKSRSGDMASGYNNTAGFTNKRTPSEYWQDTLRKTGIGRSTESRSGTFTGLGASGEMSYMSTSHYMRELVGYEKPKLNGGDNLGKTSKGTPAYKSQEDYYDEILDLRKQVASVSSENTILKARIRRLEDDGSKKDKEIEQLLNPSRSDEMRRTLPDRKADTSTVIHGLKQKILRLEQQVKEKESSLNKLKSDLKTTKVEEMKIQMETLYQEVVRLQNTSVPSADRADRKPTKETPSKMKALNDTILRMNEKNVRLTSENRTLKEDLQKLMEDTANNQHQQREYGDMSKKDLLSAISRLEKKLEKKDADNVSILSLDGAKTADITGKIKLEGSLAQRLDQLDKQETVLLEEISKQKKGVKRLKEDRQHYRTKCDDKSKEVKSLKRDVEELQAELDSFYDKDKQGTPRSERQMTPRSERHVTPRSSRPSSARRASQPRLTRRPSSESITSQASERDRQRKMKDFLENRAAKNIQKNWKQHQQTKRQQDEGEDEARKQKLIHNFQENHAAKTIQNGWKQHKVDKDQRAITQRVNNFRENRAAKKIQHGWLDHKQRVIEDHEDDNAATLIQSAWSGHQTRKKQMNKLSQFSDEEQTESDLDDAALVIQSAYRGHQTRKSNRDVISESDDEAVVTVQSAVRGHWDRKSTLAKRSPRNRSRDSIKQSKHVYNGLDSEGGSEEIEEDLLTPTSSRRSSFQRKESTRSMSSVLKRRNSKESPRSGRPRTPVTLTQDSEDDDDDICF